MGVGITLGHIHKLLGFHFYFPHFSQFPFHPQRIPLLSYCVCKILRFILFPHICIEVRVQPYFFNSLLICNLYIITCKIYHLVYIYRIVQPFPYYNFRTFFITPKRNCILFSNSPLFSYSPHL